MQGTEGIRAICAASQKEYKVKIRLGIIFGGRSEEHEVSIMSTKSVVSNIDRNKYEIELFALDKSGQPFHMKEEDLASDAIFLEQNKISFGEFADSLKGKCDVVFPILHGPYGEDGRLQGFLDMLDMKYVGCNLISSCLCMDKAYCKHILKEKGFNIPPYISFFAEEYKTKEGKERILGEIKEKLNYPIFVKPSNLGSSVGITKAHDEKELVEAIEHALRYDRSIVCETGINARELECGVLGHFELESTVVGEIVPSKEFYDYEAKYSEDALSELIIPANISEEETNYIRKEATRACILLGVRGLSRVDFLMDKDSREIYLSEINTIPGFTKYSMYPSLAKMIGYQYTELIDRLIEIALK